MKKRLLAILLTMLFVLSLSSVYAIDIDSKDKVKLDKTDKNYVESVLEGMYALSIMFDHDSGINYSGNSRQVWGRTQAWDENAQKLNSYTRARFEELVLGTVKCDSGRVYSTGAGASYAESGWLYSDQYTYIAKTYYGQ